MSFKFKTENSIIVDTDLFFVGTATYDKTTTPSNETQVTPSDGANNDLFGSSVAIGDSRIVVGALDAHVGSNADQGAAYIYDLDGTNEIKITASDGAASDEFGKSVAIGNGKIVVGASVDDSSKGSAYIFDLSGNQLAKITASDGVAGDEFGQSVAVGCGRIVVGARKAHIGSNADQGAAYIFDLDGNQLKKITASDGAANDYFGSAVAVGCGRILVSSPLDDVGSNSNQGSAYIFDLDGTQLAKITASDGAGGDIFGSGVAVGSGRIVVGAYRDDDTATNSGSAYIYDLDGNNEVKITASDAAGSDAFGYSVSVGLGRIVVGAYGQDTSPNTGNGALYIYDLDGTQLAKLTGSASNHELGYSTAIGNGKIVGGARSNALTSGKAYIYDTPNQVHYLDQLDGR